MIVLDTNVLSEWIRANPDERVLAWLRRQPGAALFVTTISLSEMLDGVHRLDEGARKRNLLQAIDATFSIEMTGRVLSYDADAANAYALITTRRRAAGKPISQFDAMIAAIAQSRGADVATRNVRDFENCGVRIINPWHA